MVNHYNSRILWLHYGARPRGYGFLNRHSKTLLPCVSDALEARPGAR